MQHRVQDEETTEQEERHAVSALCPSLTSWLSSFGAVPPQDTTVYDAIMDNDLSGLSISDTTSAGGHCGDVTPAAPVQSERLCCPCPVTTNLAHMHWTPAQTRLSHPAMYWRKQFLPLKADSAYSVLKYSALSSSLGIVKHALGQATTVSCSLVIGSLQASSPCTWCLFKHL